MFLLLYHATWLFWFLQTAYYCFFFRRLARYLNQNRPKYGINKPIVQDQPIEFQPNLAPKDAIELSKNKNFDKEKPVSVIICAKNEADNLLQNLPIVLSQNYQTFEVIVVNDASTDNTAQVLILFKKLYANLRIITLENDDNRNLKGKKYALSIGIKASSYDFLVLTDADCQPASSQWLQYMTLNNQIEANKYQKNKQNPSKEKIILGYSPYFYHNTWLNACIQYETLLTAMQYLSYTIVGIPYMGVGRNLAYSKEIYQKNNGFLPHANLISGDDDLFISRAANRNNTFITLHPHSFCYSKPPETWQQWINQKQRHLSTPTHYKPLNQLLLGIWAIIHAIPNLLFIILLCYKPQYWTHYLLFYSLKVATQLPILYPITRQLQCPLPIYQLLFIDLFWFIYYLFFSLILSRKRATIWK